MKKTKLTLFEIPQLDDEVKSLLPEKLSLVTKYWLNDLIEKLKVEVKLIEESRNDLIKKYGTEKDGNISIDYKIGDEINPKIIEFQEELSLLLSEEKDIYHHNFKLEDIKNIETSLNTTIFFKLISV